MVQNPFAGEFSRGMASSFVEGVRWCRSSNRNAFVQEHLVEHVFEVWLRTFSSSRVGIPQLFERQVIAGILERQHVLAFEET